MTALSERLALLEAQASDLYSKIHMLQEQVEPINEEIELIRNQLHEQEIAHGVDWDWLLTVFPESAARYKAVQAALHKLGFLNNGHWNYTKQTSVMLYLTRNSEESISKTVNGVTTLAPYIKPQEDGYIWFAILEHNLSEHGSYYFKASPNLDEFLVEGSWGFIQSFNNLYDAIKYIAADLWYEDVD